MMPRRVWDTQKHKIRPREPPPEWASVGPVGGQNGHFGTKKHHFLEKNIFAQNDARKVPRGSGTLGNPKLGRGSPQTGPIWAVL